MLQYFNRSVGRYFIILFYIYVVGIFSSCCNCFFFFTNTLILLRLVHSRSHFFRFRPRTFLSVRGDTENSWWRSCDPLELFHFPNQTGLPWLVDVFLLADLLTRADICDCRRHCAILPLWGWDNARLLLPPYSPISSLHRAELFISFLHLVVNSPSSASLSFCPSVIISAGTG